MSDAVTTAVRARVRCRFAVSEQDFAAIVRERMSAAWDAEAASRLTSLSLDDLYLATACARGDEDAWREFRDRHFAFIGDFSRRFLPADAAQDLRDQLIADLWQRRRFDRYDGRSSLRTWLGALITHAAINQRRSRQRNAALIAAPAGEPRVEIDREDEAAHREFAGRVDRAIAALDDDNKLLLLLYYEQGLTLEQMSTVLNASKATLSRRLASTREQLRAAIEAAGDDRPAVAPARHRLDVSRLEWDLTGALGWAALQKQRGSGV